MNKNIIIAILVIVIIGIAAFVMFSQHAPTLTTNKTDTEFSILTDNTLSNDEKVIFKLSEKNGSTIAGEKVKIGLGDKSGNVETFEVVTDSEGKGALVLEKESSGKHNLTLTYDGNEKYNGCSINLGITIDDDSSDDSDSSDNVSKENTVSSDDQPISNPSTPDNPEHWNYDSETGQYYNDDGIIVGDSQWAGTDIDELRKLYREGDGNPFEGMN